MDFYVYIHRRFSDGKIFYVGKGSKGRAWEKTNRNLHWHRTIKKHGGYTTQIVELGLQEWAAFELEKDLIALYGRRDLALGPLVNLSDGGDGSSGAVWTQEAKDKLSKSKTGSKRPPEVCAKISEALKKRVYTPEMRKNMSDARKGKRVSQETRQKLREFNLGKGAGDKNPSAKKVVLIYTDGTELAFGNQKAAAKHISMQAAQLSNILSGKLHLPTKYGLLAVRRV